MGRSGEGKIGCILWLVALLAFATVAWKAVPIKMASLELGDYMEEQGKFAGRASGEVLHRRIMKRAQQLGLPLDPKQLVVEKVGGRVRMEASYTVPLELPFYTYQWSFHHVVDLPVYIF